MPLSEVDRKWYFRQIEKFDPNGRVVKIDEINNLLIYDEVIRSDEGNRKRATDEEVVRALALCILVSKDYKYPVESFYIERYFEHGSVSAQGGRDEIDLIIYDDDDLPFAMWEFKSAEDYDSITSDRYIRFQLFGSAPLIGAPKLLVYATIKPVGDVATLKLISIDRTNHLTHDDWVSDNRPHTTTFPPAFTDPQYEPFTFEGSRDLRLDCTQADFKAVAATFHNEFFGEHPDTVLFSNVVKCLLAKIYDERQTKREEAYRFQVFYKKRRAESAQEVFERINQLYKTAYERYIDRNEADEINPKEFSPERVKTVVTTLQSMSITRGAALHGDIVGAFFEEILRTGFKQDKGMYFTHANLVYFILEALDLEGLAIDTWQRATHPENRLPYIIDPACGSGAFLLRAMQIVTQAIKSRKNSLVNDTEASQFYKARMSDEMPNYWAENFIYGMDPKFVMAITAKVNR